MLSFLENRFLAAAAVALHPATERFLFLILRHYFTLQLHTGDSGAEGGAAVLAGKGLFGDRCARGLLRHRRQHRGRVSLLLQGVHLQLRYVKAYWCIRVCVH